MLPNKSTYINTKTYLIDSKTKVEQITTGAFVSHCQYIVTILENVSLRFAASMIYLDSKQICLKD